MKAYVYKVNYDAGTAPCVENGLLSFAICKPAIRRLANIGDILVGIGGLKIGMGRLIYVAYVTEIIPPGNTHSTYYDSNGPYFHRLDCVYENVNGQPKHRGPCFSHYGSVVFFARDVGVGFKNARVLLSKCCVYLGAEGTADALIKRPPLHRGIRWGAGHWPITKATHPAEFDALTDLFRDLWNKKGKNYKGKPTHSHYADDLTQWRKDNARRLREHNDDVRKRLQLGEQGH